MFGLLRRSFNCLDIKTFTCLYKMMVRTHLDYVKKLNLPTLAYRRMRGDVIETYKIIKGIHDKESTSFLKMWTDIAQRNIGRGHGMRLYLQRSIKPVRKNSFGVRMVNIWNNLPENVVNSPNVNTFKNRLDKHWDNQEILFNDRVELKLNV